MGENMSKASSRPFQKASIFTTFKPYNTPPGDTSASPRPSIFSTLRRFPVAKSNDFVPLFSDCIAAASSRTQEYLLFKDPEDKFRPSPEVLTQIFLMTYISQSVNLNMTDVFNCTAMTPGQRVLLGADWVWAVLEKPTKNPRIQIAVQVLHLSDKEPGEENGHVPGPCSESVQMAHKESGDKNMYERMVDFCTSIGKDCYALFLFLGKKHDQGNIYGVLSNNFQAAIGKCDKIDRALLENFFKGSRYLHTPSGMMQAIVTKKEEEPLTLMIKFS
uniref:rab15 effector protein n=1 Tax=Doryrhamphus excisus TaxID=161450 RepID=UPI0025AE5197|nr:rab15 effector protein [Doryrhamphus excisus]XP_057942707.1 rab15 effector protein [Doryrhamphus excisus]